MIPEPYDVKKDNEAVELAEAQEKIAELEHTQWVAWSTNIAEKEQLSEERLKRWRAFWVEYKDLPEEIKEEDRKWARLVLEAIHILGYRKPLDRPELEKEINEAIRLGLHSFENGTPFNVVQETLFDDIMYEVAKSLALYPELPKDKPSDGDEKLKKAIGIETKRIFTLMDELALDYIPHFSWNQWLLFRNALAKKIIESQSPKG